MDNYIENKISDVVEKYIGYDAELLDNFLSQFVSIYNELEDEYKNLERLIYAAVQNRRHKEKLSNYTIELMTYVLTKKEFLKKINNCKTFDELQIAILHANLECDKLRNEKGDYREIDRIESLRHLKFDHRNFGELSVYDTALYIGYPKSILPERVFLYPKGAGKGADYLKILKLLSNTNITVLNQTDFPENINKRMESYHIENFLCVKKEDIRNICLKFEFIKK